jgi:hypothetical protein
MRDVRDQRGLWWFVVNLATVVGLLCGYAAWGWQGSALAAATVATFVAVTGGCAWMESGRRDGIKAGRLTLTVGSVMTAVIGLLVGFHGYALCVVVPLAATSPPAVSFLAHRVRRAPDEPVGSAHLRDATSNLGRSGAEPAGDDLTEPATRDLRTLDDAALCLAWRQSFLRLSAATSAADRLSVVQQRQSYVDELHRRSPDGLVAWFNSGGRASGNPLPFLGYRADVDPWEGLTPPDAGGAHL